MNDAHDAGPAAGSNASLWTRVQNVFAFETSVYPDVAAGPFTFQAIVIIAVASVLSGSALTMLFFFIAIPVSLVQTTISAGLISIIAKLFSKESPGFAAWFRALGFAEAPLILGIIPFVGSFIGGTYVIATSIAAIHRVARIPIGLAILTWLLVWLLPLALLTFLALSLGLLGLMTAAAGGM